MIELAFLALLAGPARADLPPPAPTIDVGAELPRYEFKGRPKPALTPEMAKNLETANGLTSKLVALFASRRPERCGVCPTRTDEKGVHCAAIKNLVRGCGHGCGKELLLVSAADLERISFQAGVGRVTAGGVFGPLISATDENGLKSVMQYAQAVNGIVQNTFRRSPVATCR